MKNPKKFWNWKNQTDGDGAHERVLEFYGTIAEEPWFDDDITPKMFREELFAGKGPIMTALELREKRAKLWEGTKAFLETHRKENGTVRSTTFSPLTI